MKTTTNTRKPESGHPEELSTLAEAVSTYTAAKNPTETAVKLLDNFGSLKAVFEARPEALAKVTSPAVARKLSGLLPILRALQAAEAETPEQISNARELEAYIKRLLTGERIEKFVVICVSAQCRVLGYRIIATGSLSEVNAYPRLVAETALNYNAHSVFFAHNHPGGTCAPSAEDISSTMQLQRLLSAMGILVLDHAILAGGQVYSMAQHGDITLRR